jgi:hypothetical protein
MSDKEETHTITAAEAPGSSHEPAPRLLSPAELAEAGVVLSIDDIVEQWWNDHFPNSVLSRAGTEVWNLAHAAKEELKTRLKSL